MLWYEQKIESVAQSTRIRLARNIDGIPFPLYLDKQKYRDTNKMISESIMSCDLGDIKLREINMETLGEIEAYAMVERHIISPKFAQNRDGEILLLSDDESVSIMIGEEDHIRIQVLKCGEKFDEAFQLCDKIDTEIGKKLKFAFSEELGYLTECPTNLGTGLRASVMLHLPVLESTGKLGNIANMVSKIGLVFRGFYGEGSDSKASIYQLSNQVTLGVDEKGTLENLKNIAKQIEKQEIDEMKGLDNDRLADIVFRSYGILKYARIMNTDEMMKHVSHIMLGERKGILSLPESISMMNVFITLQPAMIRRIKGDMTPNERDILRAKSLRETFSKLDIND